MSILNNLPDINFAQKSSIKIEEELIKYFEEKINRTLYPGDPMRLFLLTFVKYISLQRNNIDFAAKQNLLKYSTNDYIENLGILTGVERLQATYAITTLNFSLSCPQNNVIIIPKNTKATSTDSQIYFKTLENAEIKAGEISIEINAQCTVLGSKGNGLFPGQINKLVDPFGYLCNVENTTISSGGTDLEDLENFRERIRKAPESFSVAGPNGAYEFWAKTSNQLIADVVIYSPNPGEVEIIPLLSKGNIPTQDILDDIYITCNDKNRRPLTDKVMVKLPEQIEYDISLIYYISRSNISIGLNIQDSVNKSIEEYILWQKSKLGRDINPSELTKRIVNSGAKRIEITAPIFNKLEHFQVATARNISITYGGTEDD